MLNYVGVNDSARTKNDLGMVVCKICNEVMFTLPTNGVKKIPSICMKDECIEKTKKSEVETV